MSLILDRGAANFCIPSKTNRASFMDLSKPRCSVELTQGQQLIMCSRFDNGTRVQHMDNISMSSHSQPVSNNQRRFSLGQSPEAIKPVNFRPGIQCASRFIQDHNLRLAEKSA